MNIKLYTVEEVAGILRVSTAKVRQLIRTGELEAVQIDRQYRVSEQALNAYIERKTRK